MNEPGMSIPVLTSSQSRRVMPMMEVFGLGVSRTLGGYKSDLTGLGDFHYQLEYAKKKVVFVIFRNREHSVKIDDSSAQWRELVNI